MNRNIPSISKLNNLFLDKELKPSELFEQVYQNASFTESILHAHLELFYDEGLKTTCSSKMLSNYVSPYDATVIGMLKETGSTFTGKTNLDEFAMGSSTENSAYGPTKNPWNPDYVPGGSSGGSAAVVSAGSAVASLGSDTGGSIRQPASFCGVVGFKPTYGTVSRFGLIAFASSLDQIGPITNTVDDARIIFDNIQGYDPKDATSIKPEYTKLKNKKLKIGIIKELMQEGVSEDSQNEVNKVTQLLENSGHEVVETSLPLTEMALSVYYLIAPAECSANLSRFDGVRFGLREPASGSYEMMNKTRAVGFGEEVKKRILLGTYALSAGYFDEYYGRALKVRSKIISDFQKAFDDFDFLISPTTPSPAFKFGEKTENPLEMYLSDLCTIPANLAGLPAISIPTGLSDDNMPLSIQLMGKPCSDYSLLDLAESIEDMVSFNHLPKITKGDNES
jgi:aspartyl-tRNA(Asn)/glutamyl-tRNA(Gln) amidotransferase subunit A